MLIFPGWPAHGLQGTEAMLGMTPANLYNSAKEALVIAHKLGKKVIIMGTSTRLYVSFDVSGRFSQAGGCPGLIFTEY